MVVAVVVSITRVAARGGRWINAKRRGLLTGSGKHAPSGPKNGPGCTCPAGHRPMAHATPDPATVDCTRHPVLATQSPPPGSAATAVAAVVIRRNARHLNDRRLCETFIIVQRKTRHSYTCVCVCVSACLCARVRECVYVCIRTRRLRV